MSEKNSEQIANKFEVVNQVILLLKPNGEILYASHGAALFLGCTEKEIKQNNYFCLCEHKNLAPILSVEELNTYQCADTQIINWPKNTFHMQWSVSFIPPGNILIIGEDTTSSDAVRQQAELIQDYLDNIVKHIPCYVYWKNKNSIYLGCNDLFAKVAGLSDPQLIVGKTDYDLAWGETEAELFRKGDQEVLDGLEKLNFEESQRQADGKIATVLASKVPMRDKHNNIIGVLGIYLDITKRKQAEIELQESKLKAEAASLAKSEFLSTISHELRTPLVGILGIAQMVQTSNLTTEQLSDLTNITKAGDHLLSLVNDLLDFTKLEARKFELHPAILDLRILCEEVAMILAAKARSKGLEIIVEYDNAAPQKVLGDTRAIRQVLLNLMGNAIKFTEKGCILLKVTCKKLHTSRCTLDISIKDTGIGIPPSKLDLIFERFTQVDSSATRVYQGTGLGLTLSKDLVELMGGTIKVKSELNLGSTFICTIPFKLEKLKTEKNPWEMYKAATRILIIDESLRGKVLERQLASNNNSLIAGDEAISEILQAQRWGTPYDVILIDESLESIDAHHLAKLIAKETRIHRPMMICLQTLSKSRPKTQRKYSFEAWTKPIQPSELFINLTAAWERWCEERKPILEKLNMKTQKARILLVEDDPMVQLVHKRMLDKIGCDYEVASDGKQALEMSKQNYDLILMDIGLPEMNGIDVAKAIRQREVTLNSKPRTSIIGLTAYGEMETKEKCLNVGIDEVAIKPLAQGTMIDIIERWARHNHKVT